MRSEIVFQGKKYNMTTVIISSMLTIRLNSPTSSVGRTVFMFAAPIRTVKTSSK